MATNKVQPKVAQFIRAEGFTSSDAIGICGEMTRERGYYPHITEQRVKENPPVYLFGDETSIRAEAREIVSKSKTVKRYKKNRHGKISASKIQAKENVFLGGVTSITRELGTDKEYLKEWSTKTTEYLKELYGDHLKGVVLHSDEAHYDIHFLVVNDELDPSLDADWLRYRKEPDLSKKEVRIKENQALRAYLDNYHDKVSSTLGLDRVGEQVRPRAERKPYLAKKSADILEANAVIRMQIHHNELKEIIENSEATLAKTEENIISKQHELDEQNKKIEQKTVEATTIAEKIILEATAKGDDYINRGLAFAQKEKAHAAEAAKRNEDVKKLKEEQEKIVDDLKQRREKEENSKAYKIKRWFHHGLNNRGEKLLTRQIYRAFVL